MQFTNQNLNISITCGSAASALSVASVPSVQSVAVSPAANKSPVTSHQSPVLARGARMMQARYDAAQTSRENQRHWMMSDGLSADQANNPGVRETLRNRSRYECANSTHLKHMVRVNAYYMIGRCPQLEITNTERITEDLAQQIEDDWTVWTEREKLGRKLRILVQGGDRDGEAFLQIYTNRKYATDNTVSLSITAFEAQYVRNFSITGDYNEFTNIDGILLDESGNPEFYCVQINYYKPAVEVPAAQIIHWMKPDRPGQHRGIPETTAGLNLSAYRRDYTLSVVQAARNAADMSLFFETSDAEFDEGAVTVGALTEDIPAFETMPVDMSRGSFNFLPNGVKASMIKAEQPVNTYKEFTSEILGADAAGFSMPKNIATCDSSAYNFASGKLDFQFFATKISIEQYDFNLYVLDPIFTAWFAEYKLLPSNTALSGLDTPAHEWMYDSADPVNPMPEAKAATERMTNGTSNLAIECGKSGRDWRDVATKQIQIEKFKADARKTAGLPPETSPTRPTGQPRPTSPAPAASEQSPSPSGDNNE